MIVLLRVDNRLLHGQILEAWIPRLRVDQVVVADDEAAASPLARAAMTLCLPPELPVRIVPVAGLDLRTLAAGVPRVLLLVRDVAALATLRAEGLSAAVATTVNLGNVHFGPGRRAVTPSVYLTGAEVEALRGLAAEGIAVEARAVPAEAPAGMEEIERRYAAGR